MINHRAQSKCSKKDLNILQMCMILLVQPFNRSDGNGNTAQFSFTGALVMMLMVQLWSFSRKLKSICWNQNQKKDQMKLNIPSFLFLTISGLKIQKSLKNMAKLLEQNQKLNACSNWLAWKWNTSDHPRLSLEKTMIPWFGR